MSPTPHYRRPLPFQKRAAQPSLKSRGKKNARETHYLQPPQKNMSRVPTLWESVRPTHSRKRSDQRCIHNREIRKLKPDHVDIVNTPPPLLSKRTKGKRELGNQTKKHFPLIPPLSLAHRPPAPPEAKHTLQRLLRRHIARQPRCLNREEAETPLHRAPNAAAPPPYRPARGPGPLSLGPPGRQLSTTSCPAPGRERARKTSE